MKRSTDFDPNGTYEDTAWQEWHKFWCPSSKRRKLHLETIIEETRSAYQTMLRELAALRPQTLTVEQLFYYVNHSGGNKLLLLLVGELVEKAGFGTTVHEVHEKLDHLCNGDEVHYEIEKEEKVSKFVSSSYLLTLTCRQ